MNKKKRNVDMKIAIGLGVVGVALSPIVGIISHKDGMTKGIAKGIAKGIKIGETQLMNDGTKLGRAFNALKHTK